MVIGREREHTNIGRKNNVVIIIQDGELSPVEVSENSDNLVSRYLASEIKQHKTRLRKYKNGLKNVRKKGANIQPRRRREQRNVRKQLNQVILARQNSLDVLQGKSESFSPIRILYKEGEPTGWLRDEFSDAKEHKWWRLVSKDVEGLYDVVVGNPEDTAIIRKGFELRYQENYALTSDEREKAVNEWQGSFSEKIKSINEKRITIIGPLLRKIGEELVRSRLYTSHQTKP